MLFLHCVVTNILICECVYVHVCVSGGGRVILGLSWLLNAVFSFQCSPLHQVPLWVTAAPTPVWERQSWQKDHSCHPPSSAPHPQDLCQCWGGSAP